MAQHRPPHRLIFSLGVQVCVGVGVVVAVGVRVGVYKCDVVHIAVII